MKSLVRPVIQRCGFRAHRSHKVWVSAQSFPANPFDAQKALLDGIGITTPVVFDVGAHKGGTVEKYRARFPDLNIYCFEPFLSSTEVLNKRYKNDPSVKVIPLAVSDKSGNKTFYVNEFDATNSLLPRPTTVRRYYPKKAGSKSTLQVAVTTIDEFVHSHRIENLNILKFDIQGSELMALRGAVNTLRKKHVPLIYTETMFIPHYEGNPLFYELWSFLTDFGYTLFDVYNLSRAINGQLRQGDALFVSREVRERVIDKYQEES